MVLNPLVFKRRLSGWKGTTKAKVQRSREAFDLRPSPLSSDLQQFPAQGPDSAPALASSPPDPSGVTCPASRRRKRKNIGAVDWLASGLRRSGPRIDPGAAL